MAPEEITLDTGHLRLAARVRGPTHDRPVLALHGWLDNAASFDPIAPMLDGLHLVALDLPGHGRSDHRPPGQGYHLTDYVGDVLDAADALGWTRFSLLGHSLGGIVATLLAAACPERIERLALIEALGPISEAAEHAPDRLSQALTRRARAGRRQMPGYETLDDAVEARRAVGGLSDAAARRLVERATVTEGETVRWRSDPRLRWPSPFRFTEEQGLAFLGAMQAPTLVIAADGGLVLPEHPVIARRLEAIPDLRLHRLPGNHHLHLEEPGPVAARLAPFLQGSS